MISKRFTLQISVASKLHGPVILMAVAVLLGGCGQAGSNPVDVPEESQPAAVTPVQTVNEAGPATNSKSDHNPEARVFDLDTSHLKQETRAIWSTAGRKRVPGTDKISMEDIDDLVAKVDAAHLNVIFLSVYKGEALFEPSHTRFPDSQTRLPNVAKISNEKYGDALSYLLAIRDERRADNNPFNDFEVHAWFNVHVGGEEGDGWPPEDKTEPGMLNALFPEFKLKYGAYYLENDERFVDHAVSVVHQPKFRAYMTDLIAGLVEDYDVDGVHLDHIRASGICFNNEYLDYPGTEYDYPGCQEDYKRWTRETYGQEYTLWDDTDGHKKINDEARDRVSAWQRQAVGMLVKSIHDEVKAINPNLIISVASVRNDTSQTRMEQLVDGQAAWEWLDQGWIDAIFSTAYTADTQSIVDKIQSVRQAVQVESRRSRVFPGLSTYDTDNPTDLWSFLVVEQVEATMFGQGGDQPLEPPAKGVALFVDRRFSDEAARALGQGPFKEPARPYWGD